MTTRLAALIIVAAIAMPALVWAHAGHHHLVMGTIRSVGPRRLVVVTTDETTHHETGVSIALDGKTTFRRGDAATSREALKVGERVVVSVGDGKPPLKAAEVRVK